ERENQKDQPGAFHRCKQFALALFAIQAGAECQRFCFPALLLKALQDVAAKNARRAGFIRFGAADDEQGAPRAVRTAKRCAQGNWRGHQRRGQLAERQSVVPCQECLKALAERIAVIRGKNDFRSVARRMEIDGVAAGQSLEDTNLARVGLALDSNHQKTWAMCVAGRVVNFPVIHCKERGSDLDKPVHHFFQFRRVASESHGREPNRYVALDDGLGDLPAGIRLNTYSWRLHPTSKTTKAVGQFHFAQGEGFDVSAVSFEHLGQHAENGREVMIGRRSSIEDYDFLRGHGESSSSKAATPRVWRVALAQG